jgi:hypothetical protein
LPDEATAVTPDMPAQVVERIPAVEADMVAGPLAVRAPAMVATAEGADPHPTAPLPAAEPAQGPALSESDLPTAPDAAPAASARNVIVVAVGPSSKPRPLPGRISAGVRKTKRRKAVGPDGVA